MRIRLFIHNYSEMKDEETAEMVCCRATFSGGLNTPQI